MELYSILCAEAGWPGNLAAADTALRSSLSATIQSPLVDSSLVELELARRKLQSHELRRAAHDKTAAELCERRADLEHAQKQIRILRSEVAQRDKTIEALRTALQNKVETSREIAGLRSVVDRQSQQCETLSGRIELAARSWWEAEYANLIQRIHGVVGKNVPADATVIVVSKGDPAMLRLDGHTGWHFPRHSDGTHSGRNPSDGIEAIAHLQELRRAGGQFFLIPSTALWWLDHYKEFREHLMNSYAMVVNEKDTCLLFNLTTGRTEQ
jgi:hypothetical protein